MDREPITLICIAAHAHSGSTLLDQMLGSHEQVVSLGGFARYRSHMPRRCACGAPQVDACPFWSRVEQQLHADVGLSLGELELREPASADFVTHNLAVMRAVQRVSGKQVFVDSTKSFRRLRGLLAMEQADLRLLPVHLVRGPHGVVCSNMRKGRPWFAQTLNYSREMVRYRAALRGAEHVRVRYERLCTQPEVQLGRILREVGLSFDDRQREWATQEHHNLGGNRMRKRQDSTIRLDERWREQLTGMQRVVISAVTGLFMPSSREATAEAMKPDRING